MYKAIIVDDEHLIRKSLIKTINWMELGIQIEGEAANGKEALNIIKKLHPQIILSDIRMPVMDGIELAKEVKNLFPETRVIFLSGYDEFSYAQQALRIGVDDYVLKPIDNDKVCESIIKVIASIETKAKKDDDIEVMKMKVRDAHPIVRNSLFNDLILGIRLSGKDNTLCKLASIGISLANNNYIIMSIRIDNFEMFSQQFSEEDIQLYTFCISNIAEEILNRNYRAFAFECHSGEVCVIAEVENPENKKRSEKTKGSLINIAIEIQESIEKYLSFTTSILISGVVQGIEKIPNSFEELSKVQKQRMNIDENSVIHLDDINIMGRDKYYDTINKAKAYISQNLGKDISLMEIAEYVELSPNYFCNIFKQKTGVNLLDYILSEKMEKARAYLVSTNLKVYEVAGKVGYSDSKYFCTVFRKYFNYAPSDIKKNLV